MELTVKKESINSEKADSDQLNQAIDAIKAGESEQAIALIQAVIGNEEQEVKEEAPEGEPDFKSAMMEAIMKGKK